MPSNQIAEIIGYIGGILLSLCCIPQLITMYSNKSAKDVSLLYAVLYTTGLSFTLAYMIMLQATAAMVTLSFQILMGLAILFLKIYYDHLEGSKRPADENFTGYKK